MDRIIHVNEPPLAEAGTESILECVNTYDDLTIPFDASKSSDANNDPLSYIWDFGDGQSTQGAQVTHRFTDVGKYDVKLIVKDGSNIGCGAGVDFVSVRIDRAPIADAGMEGCGCAGESLVFDGTNSQTDTKGTLLANWNFGDGKSAQGLKVTHAYDKPGKYQALLKVTNELNAKCAPSEDKKDVLINTPPQVKLKAASSSCLGDAVTFEAIADDADADVLEYYWSFGDGEIARTGSKVTHQYNQGGTYNVTVIVDDKKGCSCSTATATTQIKINTPPIADAGANLSCCVGAPTEFNASASTDPDGEPLTYSWDFGDGTKAVGVITSHAYQKGGSYNVSVTIDDNSATSCSKSTVGFSAQVNSSPVPVISVK
jgi:PKD repeat protein